MQIRSRSVLAVLTAAAVGVAGLVVAGATASSAQNPASATATGIRTVTPSEAITRISLTIDGFEIAAFDQLIGITTEGAPPPDFQDPDRPVAAPPTLVLRRPYNSDVTLSTWQRAVEAGDPSGLRDCSLVMYNAAGEPVGRYFLTDAYPLRIRVAKAVAPTETVTFTAESVERLATP